MRRLVVQSPAGSFGFLPRRLDCILPLSEGILVYEADGERYVALDEGFLVKAGETAEISARRAIGGSLAALGDVVAREVAVQQATAQLTR